MIAPYIYVYRQACSCIIWCVYTQCGWWFFAYVGLLYRGGYTRMQIKHAQRHKLRTFIYISATSTSVRVSECPSVRVSECPSVRVSEGEVRALWAAITQNAKQHTKPLHCSPVDRAVRGLSLDGRFLLGCHCEEQAQRDKHGCW
jgi:hypothetical protein